MQLIESAHDPLFPEAKGTAFAVPCTRWLLLTRLPAWFRIVRVYVQKNHSSSRQGLPECGRDQKGCSHTYPSLQHGNPFSAGRYDTQKL